MRSLFALRLALSLVFAPVTMAFVHAGDVQVQVQGSTLLIQGSPKNDDFSITGSGDAVVVQAVGLGTTINGKSEVSIRDGATKNIRVDLGSGHDRCDIHQLSCLSLSVVDGLKTDVHNDKIRLKDVNAGSFINVFCFGGDDLVSGATVDAGLELKVGTGEGDDIAALYDVIAVDLMMTMGSGDDMVIAGEFDCENVKILGGTDTWTRADAFDRLAGDVILHVDIFEISEFDILGAASEFENKLSVVEDVMDTPLEDAFLEIESSLGF